MTLDYLAKLLLTVIALALSVIAVKLFAGEVSVKCGPSHGDFMALKEIEDATTRRETQMRLLRSIPLVRVRGGDIEVTGSVSVDGVVSVER